jgi:hypothetical protein
MGIIRRLVEVDKNYEPTKDFTEIYGRFPIQCGKCFKEIDAKFNMVAFCESSSFENFVWFTPLHLECANDISRENDQVLIPVSLAKELDPHEKFHKIFFDKKDGC